MDIRETDIPDVRVIRPARHGDRRGYVAESYSRRRYAEAGIADDFVQDNLSYSAGKGTIRGFHFQKPPHAQAKLVSVLAGEILDVVVDIRHGSPWFGRHVSVRLSADKGDQLYVPEGFAHAFCTLAPDCQVFYKVGEYYAPEHEAGILFSDPEIGCEWPVAAGHAIVSDKDRKLPRLAEMPVIFRY